MGIIQAIQTHHLGCHFRSRIEARWASFFDDLEIKWDYEKEGYELDSGRYLPDFWLPEHGCFVEIKGAKPTPQEIRTASSLCSASSKSVYIFSGSIHAPRGSILPPAAIHFYPIVDDSHGSIEVGTDEPYYWCQCHFCESLGMCFQGRSNRLPCKAQGCQRSGGDPDKGINFSSASLIGAYTAASSARFEFGEGR